MKKTIKILFAVALIMLSILFVPNVVATDATPKFKINEVEFQAEEGMSWVQWAASSYNTIGLKCTEEGCPYYDIDETTYHELGAYFDPVTGTYSYAEGIPVRGNSMKGKYKITAGADYNVNVGEYV